MDAREKIQKAVNRLAKIDGFEMNEDVWIYINTPIVEGYFYNLIPKTYGAKKVVEDPKMDDVFLYAIKKTYEYFKPKIKEAVEAIKKRQSLERQQPKTTPKTTTFKVEGTQTQTQTQQTETRPTETKVEGDKKDEKPTDKKDKKDKKDKPKNNTEGTKESSEAEDGNNPTEEGKEGDKDTEKKGESKEGGKATEKKDKGKEGDDEQHLLFEVIDDGKESITKRVGNVIKKSLESVKESFKKGFNKLKEGLGKVGGLLKSGFKKAKTNLIAVLLLLFLFFRTNFLEKLKQGFKEQFPNLYEKIEGVVSSIKEKFDKVKEWFGTIDWADKFDDLKNTVLTIYEWIKGIFGENKAEKAEREYGEAQDKLYKIFDKGAFDKLGINEIQMAQMNMDDIEKLDGYKNLNKQEQAAIKKIKNTDFSDYISLSEQKALRKLDPNVDISKMAEGRLAREAYAKRKFKANQKVMSVDGIALDLNDAQQTIIVNKAVENYVNNLSEEQLTYLGEGDNVDVDTVLEGAKVGTDGLNMRWANGVNLLDQAKDYARKVVNERQKSLKEVTTAMEQNNTTNSSTTNNISTQQGGSTTNNFTTNNQGGSSTNNSTTNVQGGNTTMTENNSVAQGGIVSSTQNINNTYITVNQGSSVRNEDPNRN